MFKKLEISLNNGFMANSTIASRQKEAESVLKTYERGLVLVPAYYYTTLKKYFIWRCIYGLVVNGL